MYKLAELKPPQELRALFTTVECRDGRGPCVAKLNNNKDSHIEANVADVIQWRGMRKGILRFPHPWVYL